jgi:hypothetical protein
MIEVMKILGEAGGGKQPVEFFSAPFNPENRITKIRQAIVGRRITPGELLLSNSPGMIRLSA